MSLLGYNPIVHRGTSLICFADFLPFLCFFVYNKQRRDEHPCKKLEHRTLPSKSVGEWLLILSPRSIMYMKYSRHSDHRAFPHLRITGSLWELHEAIEKLSKALCWQVTLMHTPSMSYKLQFSWERYPEYDCCLSCLWHKCREKHLFQQSRVSDHTELSWSVVRMPGFTLEKGKDC